MTSPSLDGWLASFEGDDSRLFSIAILLRVIGLILVLARDLRRR